MSFPARHAGTRRPGNWSADDDAAHTLRQRATQPMSSRHLREGAQRPPDHRRNSGPQDRSSHSHRSARPSRFCSNKRTLSARKRSRWLRRHNSPGDPRSTTCGPHGYGASPIRASFCAQKLREPPITERRCRSAASACDLQQTLRTRELASARRRAHHRRQHRHRLVSARDRIRIRGQLQLQRPRDRAVHRLHGSGLLLRSRQRSARGQTIGKRIVRCPDTAARSASCARSAAGSR